MADPVIPGGVRILSVLEGKSGLPEDVYVNSWGFLSGSVTGYTAIADAAVARLTTFYSALYGMLAGNALNGTHRFKAYDLSIPAPRPPRSYVETFSPNSSPQLPNEVAIVLSFYGGINTPRTRGRLYMGPLLIGTGANNDTRGDFVPQSGQIALITAAANTLRQATDVRWSVISGANANAVPIDRGWVDNAYDTQRRRGTAPDARTTWGATG